MKAIVCNNYGTPDVLELREVAKPIPKSNEILIKVHATTVTAADIRVRSFRSPLLWWIPMRLVLGIRRPRKPILGVELAGEIEEVGSEVTRFRKGDRVFAMTGMRFGSYAEYAILPEKGVVAPMPSNASYEEAAVLPFGGTTALHFLRKGNVRNGIQVLVYGASGAVGVAAVQLAKHFGAEVTGVCSGANAEFVQALGADRVIDYAKENFAKQGRRYDLIFDAVGKTSRSRCAEALTSSGKYVTVEGQGVAKERREDLELLAELFDGGKIRPVIDRRYQLEQVADAHRYVDTGRKKGNVVIAVR